jgi:predicted metal-dependent hydrolase
LTGLIRVLQIGQEQIAYRLLFSPRQTLEIAAYPDGEIWVKAPLGTTNAIIEKKIKKRVGWIRRQKRFFEQFSPRTPTRAYVSGETHLFLGKKYRLKLVGETPLGVKMIKGFLFVNCGEEHSFDTIKRLLNNWYKERAGLLFKTHLRKIWPLFSEFGYDLPPLRIIPMKKRWGSMSTKGLLTLNLELIKTPLECIDYVIIHELCHLKHRSHNEAFYRLLNSMLPNWERVKHKLEMSLL